MQNPFVYGEVVPAPAFADRVVELDRLVADLAAGQKVFLISPRRYGKSSLVRHALAAMAQARRADDRGDGQQLQLLRRLSRGVRPGRRGLRRRDQGAIARGPGCGRWSVRRAPRSATAWTPDLIGALSVSFPGVRSDRDVSRLAQEVFALPARLAEARGRAVVVALDEFQAIGGFNGGSVEHALRAAVQHQRNVGYVFAGSEPSLMERMLGPKRPFYKAGPVIRLERIPAEEFAAFIDSRFQRSGVKPEAGLGTAIVELAGNLPYDVQRLAHETWDEVRMGGRRRATLDDLHQALRRLLAEQHTLFEAAWQRLTLPQRSVLRAVVLEEGRELLSAEARDRHRLGGASTVQYALTSLLREDLISREGDRYIVVDSLLREWVARRTF